MGGLSNPASSPPVIYVASFSKAITFDGTPVAAGNIITVVQSSAIVSYNSGTSSFSINDTGFYQFVINAQLAKGGVNWPINNVWFEVALGGPSAGMSAIGNVAYDGAGYASPGGIEAQSVYFDNVIPANLYNLGLTAFSSSNAAYTGAIFGTIIIQQLS